MAADSFINYVNNLAKDLRSIDIADIFQNHFSPSPPVQIKIKYGGNVQDFVGQARNCIISNLKLNPFFEKKTYERKHIQAICSLLLDCKENVSDDQLAQIIFLLHSSKGKLDSKYFAYLFSNLSTIQLTTSDLEDEYTKIFNCLKNNDQIKSIIHKVVNEISGEVETFDFDLCKVAYFKSNIRVLSGFAGLDTIYVSESQQENLNMASDSYSYVEKLIILKCNFIRLVLYETTHIALRTILKGFNLTNSNIDEGNFQAVAKVSYDRSLEAGLMSEKELFTDRIDWIKSVMNSKLNTAYLS